MAADEGIHVLYGPAIREAIASGDVDKMKEVEKQAEEHLQEYGNISAAAEALKVEIARAEQGG
jgi:phage shock protein A